MWVLLGSFLNLRQDMEVMGVIDGGEVQRSRC